MLSGPVELLVFDRRIAFDTSSEVSSKSLLGFSFLTLRSMDLFCCEVVCVTGCVNCLLKALAVE